MTLKLNGYSTAQFGKCHEVPPWQTSPIGPFDAWPTGGGGFEHFYGFIGGENNQYYPALYEGIDPGRAGHDPRGGLPPHRGPGRPRDRLGPHPEVARARQAVLRVLRPRRHPRAAPRAAGVGGQLRRPVRAGLGRAARVDLRAAEAARCRARRRGTDRAAGRDPGVGRDGRRAQAGAGTPDGGVRRLPRTHRLPCRPRHRRDRGHRRAGEHARLLHHRRQRGLRRGNGQRRVQRDGELQRPRRDRDPGVHGGGEGQARHGGGLQPLLGRLGVGDVRAVPVDQAGRLALGRHPQRHDRALARRHHQQRRDPLAVHPRHRRRPHRPRGRRAARAHVRQRRAAVADRGHQHALQLRRRRRAGTARPAVLRDGRQPRHLLQGLERGHPAQHPVAAERGTARARRRRVGTLRRDHRLDPGPRPGRRTTGTARRPATTVADRSGQVQRAADRRPPLRATQRRPSPVARNW